MRCIVISTLLLLAASYCWGQNLQSLPNAPTPQHKPPTEPHKFLDRDNLLLISGSAASIAVDGLTTRRTINPYFGVHELNPIARPFTKSNAGAAAYFAGSFGAEVGAMYLLHKTGHHRMERILPWVVTGAELFWSVGNAANRAKLSECVSCGL